MTGSANTTGEHNATVEAIVARLPKGALVTPMDIAAAIGFRSSSPILKRIECGEIAALNYGTPTKAQYFIHRDVAVEHIRSRASGTF